MNDISLKTASADMCQEHTTASLLNNEKPALLEGSQAYVDLLLTSERDNLRKDLERIFSVPAGEADLIIKQATVETLRALRDAFSRKVKDFSLEDIQSRNWRKFSMALLPFENIKIDEVGAFEITPNRNDSLMFLNYEEATHEDLKRHLSHRRALCQSIGALLEAETYQQYMDLVLWNDSDGISPLQPNNEDLGVAQTIYAIEVLFDLERGCQEQIKRQHLGLNNSEPTPWQYEDEIAARASDRVLEWLERWDVIPTAELDPANVVKAEVGKDSSDFLLRLLNNIAANRALLERAQIADISQQARDANFEFVQALNRHGIEIITRSISSDDDIRRILKAWVGPHGVLAKDPLVGGRSLSGHDLEVLMVQIDHVQAHYLKTRGALVNSQHNNQLNRFYFALALAAGYFKNASVSSDVNPTKMVKAFPPRQLGQARMGTPSRNALELFSAMYGQLFFSAIPQNSAGYGYDVCDEDEILRADFISNYVRGKSSTRKYIYSLVFLFKRYPPENILRLSNKIDELVAQFEEHVHQSPVKYRTVPESDRNKVWFIQHALAWVVMKDFAR